jgi:sulfane dehydrogenase subunit SoxC
MKPERREFLKRGSKAAGLAALALQSKKAQSQETSKPGTLIRNAGAYGDRSEFEKAGRIGEEGSNGGLTPLQDTVGIITPSALHYVISHGNVQPALKIDPKLHRFMLHGMVDRPLVFSVDELKQLPSVSRILFIECASNTSPKRSMDLLTVQQRHGRTSCSEWTGVALSLLLKEAGVRKGASWIIAQGAEPAKLTFSIPLDKAMEDCIVAYGQNGEAIRPENGYPLRLITPGFEGINNVKWLTRVKVVNQPYMEPNETAQHTSLRLDGKARWYMFELGPKSVITRPSGGQRMRGPGYNAITGLAWSGGGTVKKVEVSTDGGRTWQEAKLQEPVLRLAHARFHFDWLWNGEETVIQSRCTDDQGNVQPTLEEIAQIWGVEPDYFRTTTNHVARFNGIQPWRVTKEGTVHNAMLF